MSASNKITGVVDRVRTMTRHTKFGDKNIHLATVDGVEFETGFKSVFSQGEMITIGVEHKYGAWQYVEVVPNLTTLPAVPAAGAAPASGGGGSGKGAGGFPVDPKSGQISIIRQNSLNRAVEILAQWSAPQEATGYHPIFIAKDEGEYLKKLLEVALIVTDFNSGQHIMDLQAAKDGNMEVAASG